MKIKNRLFFVFFIILFHLLGNNVFSNLKISDFDYELQRPSYVEKIGENELKCDEQKDECKVNFKFINRENKKSISNKYDCEIIADFELPEFKNNCNPTTIIIPKNTNKIIKIKIYEKDNLDNFVEKELFIKNKLEEKNKEEANQENSGVGTVETGSGKTGTGEILESDVFDFKYILQRPSYIIEESKNNYICDSERDECKVNFKLIDLKEKDISNKFNCEIITNFDIGEEKSKCNPNTIIIPKNSEEVIKIKVFKKDNPDNFKEKEIKILNKKEENQQGSLVSGMSTGTTETGSGKILENSFDFKYILQSPSYVERYGENDLLCDSEKDECKINFNFTNLEGKNFGNKYNCEIKADFELPEFSNNCNPTTIIIPENTEQIIKIKVFEKDNIEKFSEKEILVNNKITHYLPQTHIQVQGKITKYKKLGYKNMTCYTYDKCGVNFTSGILSSLTHYKWDFKNGEKYYGYNPKTVYFKPGFYRVKLITSNKFGNRKVENFKLTVKQLLKKSEQNLLKNNLEKIVKFKETTFLEIDKEVEITKLFKKTQKNIVKNIENNKVALAPGKIVKNIFGKGVKKKKKKLTFKKSHIIPFHKGDENKINQQRALALGKKLKKNIKLHISFQKKNLKISGKTFSNSRVEIKIGKIKYKTFANNFGKYSLKINNLIAGKYKIQASVFDKKGILIARKKSREKNITKKYITQLNNYKFKKVAKKYKKKAKYYKNKIKKIKVSTFLPPPKFEKNISFNFKIFAINTIIAILSLILINILLFRKKII